MSPQVTKEFEFHYGGEEDPDKSDDFRVNYRRCRQIKNYINHVLSQIGPDSCKVHVKVLYCTHGADPERDGKGTYLNKVLALDPASDPRRP